MRFIDYERSNRFVHTKQLLGRRTLFAEMIKLIYETPINIIIEMRKND